MNKPLVLRSLESPDGTRCVDLFRRADGSFGFEEYRRDAEDPRGWAQVGDFGGRIFDSEDAANTAAHAAVAWLGEAIGDVKD